MGRRLWAFAAAALGGLLAFCGPSGLPPRPKVLSPASINTAVEEAQASSFPPPDWLRVSTTVPEDGVASVSQAVLAISEGLQLERYAVLRLTADTADADSQAAAAARLALWVPPKSLLLVSSMIGEAQEDPMILVEGLDEDGEAEFFKGELALADAGAGAELKPLLEESCLAPAWPPFS
ncbi:unnamed protein product [Effrenium voratum]|uniref:Lipoprotein n=1 Tax=Effrenium voratum TaxID=2562239 RepID=A0AA36JE57_9DINO|nr:unnamed protein product [Effrenium voratum]